MKFPLLVTCLTLIISFAAFAQSSPVFPELDSDRPNYTQGAKTVPHKTIQLETGFGYESDKS